MPEVHNMAHYGALSIWLQPEFKMKMVCKCVDVIVKMAITTVAPIQWFLFH